MCVIFKLPKRVKRAFSSSVCVFSTYVWWSGVSLTSGDSLSWEGHNKPLLKEFSVTWEFKTSTDLNNSIINWIVPATCGCRSHGGDWIQWQHHWEVLFEEAWKTLWITIRHAYDSFFFKFVLFCSFPVFKWVFLQLWAWCVTTNDTHHNDLISKSLLAPSPSTLFFFLTCIVCLQVVLFTFPFIQDLPNVRLRRTAGSSLTRSVSLLVDHLQGAGDPFPSFIATHFQRFDSIFQPITTG